MGATVYLYNRYDRLISKVLTNDLGIFAFASLLPDSYSIRVTLASFVPALKQHIAVQPGMQSILAVNLASVLSSIELISSSPGQGLLSDDWKWALRSSMSTRPILRFRGGAGLGVDISDPNYRHPAALFSGTRGLFRVSAGDSGIAPSLGNEPDLGTAFALATSIFGSNHVQVAGNVGYSSNLGTPTTAFRTSFSHNDAGAEGPQVNVTMRQFTLPARIGQAITGGPQDGVPALRTMAIGVVDHVQVSDGIRLDYGASMESVQFFDRLNYVSPFARLTYDIGSLGSIALGYSSGLPPADLLAPSGDADADLQRDVAALSMFPRVSVSDSRAHVQRSENMEIGYNKVSGSRKYSVGVYEETVSNAAMTMSAPDGLLPAGDLLPDLGSNASVFNVGGYRRMGMMAAITQTLAEVWSLSLAYGNGGSLHLASTELESADPKDLRANIRSTQRHWVMAQVSGEIPKIGTRVHASYQWTDRDSLMPGHVWVTQSLQAPVGLNIRVRQPIGSLGLVPGRIEATAEIRNLLAQGYLPINLEGRRAMLIQAPRSVRGGLSFIF